DPHLFALLLVPAGLPFEAGPDEIHDVAVQDIVGIVAYAARTMVLHVLLVQDVRADLRAPLDSLLLAARLHLLLQPLAFLAFPQAALEHRHCLLAVLDLRLAVLARHYDLVRRSAAPHETHGGVRRVDRLATRSRGPVD